MRRLLCIMLVATACLCATACRENTSIGTWRALEPFVYHFDLREDGTCVMFDENDEWVSAGTYSASENYIAFKTDTGEFTWVWDEESESMLFEAGEDTFHFRKDN